MLKVEFRAMGCRMSALLDVESVPAAQALQQVPLWFEEWEQVLSRFRPHSELSRLNALADRPSGRSPLAISPVMSKVVSAAMQAAEWSQGLVTPCVLADLEKAGYDRSFDQLTSHYAPHTEPHLAPLPAPAVATLEPRSGAPSGMDTPIQAGWQAIRLDSVRNRLSLPPGMRLDFGGVAKGWAAQQAMLRLSTCGPALVDAGGDIAISGWREDGRPWPVAVADPLGADPLTGKDQLDLLALGRCGVATSGIDYRRWHKNGVLNHHIIDPRSGQPAQTDLLSVTVVAPTVMQAETAAKVVLILGSQVGLDWLEAQPDLAGLLAFPDGRLIYSSAMRAYSWS